MSENNSSKRKLEEDSNAYNKKVKSISIPEDDLKELKESITREIWQKLEARFSKLEEKIEKLTQENEGHVDNAQKDAESLVTRPKTPPASDNKNKPTFGGSSFKLNTSNKATSSNSFTSTSEEVPTVPNTRASSPKHVFGSTSSFGSRSIFDSIKGKNVFESTPSQSASQKAESVKSASPSLKTSFGANSKFANAFQNVVQKKSFLDSEEAQEGDKSLKSEKVAEQYKKVDLQPVKEIKTGEENEKSHFNSTTKIFELDLTNISEGWKERGLGSLHLNQSLKDPSQVRLVMRSQGLLRLILNMRVESDTKFMKGLEASLNPGKFLRFNSLSGDNKPVQYMLKFGSQAHRDELAEKLEDLQKTMSGEQNGVNQNDS